MKKALIVTLIIGILLLGAGGGLIAYAYINRPDTELITNTYNLEESFTNISVDIGAENIEFVVSEEKKVVCEETEEYKNNVIVENDTLKITQQANEEVWWKRVFSFDFAERKVTVYMPAAALNELNISASTGSVTIPSAYSFNKANIVLSTGALYLEANVTNELAIQASTGSISVKNISPKSLTAEASTGRITVENVNVQEVVDLRASTGHVVVNGLRCKSLNVKTSTGHMDITNAIVEEGMTLKASTGDVDLVDSDAATIKIETSTGDVTGVVLTSKIFYATSDTGYINVPHTTTGGSCEIKTSTGDITMSIKS